MESLNKLVSIEIPFGLSRLATLSNTPGCGEANQPVSNNNQVALKMELEKLSYSTSGRSAFVC